MSCSRQAALISDTSAAVFLMSGTSLISISPASWAAFTVCDESGADLGRRGLATLGELAHFRCDHREATAMLAGARRLDRGVERQQIGLPGDLLHDRNLLGDRAHRLDGAADGLAAGLRIGRRLAGDLLGLPRRCRRSA